MLYLYMATLINHTDATGSSTINKVMGSTGIRIDFS